MTTRLARRRLVAAFSALVAGLGLAFTGSGAASAATTISFPGSVPAWVTAAADKGAAKDTSVEGEIYLELRDLQGAEQLATAASTPGSRQYRQTLSPDEWIARFSPTVADYRAKVAYLKGRGLTITSTPKSRLFIVFRGSAVQVGGVLGTTLHVYAHAGHDLVAPSSAPSLPSDVGSGITAVALDQAKLLTHPTSVSPDPDVHGAGAQVQRNAASPSASSTAPCSTYYGQYSVTLPAAYGKTTFPTAICGYTPAQLRSAYGIQPLANRGLTGAGQTVAITDAYASPTIESDVNAWAAAVGEPRLNRGQYRQIVPAASQFSDKALCQVYPDDWQSEQTLDVEAVHGVAPAANILYVGGVNCGGGLDTALSTVLDSKLATVVSNSWGNVGEDLAPSVLDGQSHLFLQAAGEGIGVYFSSGDSGDETVNGLTPQPDFPASSPWVTSVGGTSLGIDKNGGIALETGWGSDLSKVVGTGYSPAPPGTFRFGAGGGRSTYFPEPAYQKGVVPDALARGNRVSPDVSALADPFTGYLIGYSPLVDDQQHTGAFLTEAIGGTSLASPLMAAQIALTQQLTGSTVGFANPTIYAIDRVAPSVFRDVLPTRSPTALGFQSPTSGNRYLVTLDRDTSLTTTSGYDDVTGIGGISFEAIREVAQGRH